METPELDEGLVKKLVVIYGELGQQWCDSFPALLARFREEWDIRELAGGFSYVGFSFVSKVVLGDGTKAVLKLAPSDKEFANEIEALKLYDGHGAVRLLASDSQAVALLLERIEPGTMLTEMDDDVAATEIAANAFKALYRPLPAEHTFPTIARWGQAFERVREKYNGGCGAFPSELFEPAAEIYRTMCADQDEPVLLHGDFHHFNILRSGDGWVAIDPKGLAGERAYEIGPLLWNKTEGVQDLRGQCRRRIAQASEILGVDRQRLLMWGFGQSVLSVLWNFEDDGVVREQDYRVARALLAEVRATV